MFTHLFPVLTTTLALIAGGLSQPVTNADAAAPATASFEAAPAITVQLGIVANGNGYYEVVVSGSGFAPNATIGARVYGDDTWFDDLLFSIVTSARTSPSGTFAVSRTVHGSTLNEDWEGTDEIYAVAVIGSTSVRTNTVSRSF